MQTKITNDRIEYVPGVLPADYAGSCLIARIMSKDGPAICTPRGDLFFDLTEKVPTVSHLLSSSDPVGLLKSVGTPLAPIEDVIRNSDERTRDPLKPFLLSPLDLQAVKACGVTFIASLLDRVIEEIAGGDRDKLHRAASSIAFDADSLRKIVPGSAQAAALKEALVKESMWSQYLEVGLGPDAEIFTKAQPLASVGHGATIGIHPRSVWNNPEPELVLICSPNGKAVGACIGNDVNLRDFEGRSALLLGRAKDNNASASLGPFIRLFDDDFTLERAGNLTLSLDVSGTDGFRMTGSNSVSDISRGLEDLIGQLFDCHQYPDGVALFTGTLFVPRKDRDELNLGFTHKRGDMVAISCPSLGTLINRVGWSTEAPRWDFGAVDLFRSLTKRGYAF